jgi:hypothetical protein
MFLNVVTMVLTKIFNATEAQDIVGVSTNLVWRFTKQEPDQLNRAHNVAPLSHPPLNATTHFPNLTHSLDLMFHNAIMMAHSKASNVMEALAIAGVLTSMALSWKAHEPDQLSLNPNVKPGLIVNKQDLNHPI